MKIFFAGIGGSGVSAIAGFAAGKGHKVSGSDRQFDKDPSNIIRIRLESAGIRIVPQDGSGLDETLDKAVFSTAVEPSNPDLQMARALGISVRTRPEHLADIVSEYRTIAVAGTSGKSTTSGLLAFLMHRLEMSPNFIGGGRVKQFRTDSNPGNFLTGRSDHLVIEACESDGSIVNYRPAHSIIANLDIDHHSIGETAGMFEQLADNTSGLVIVNADDWNLKACRIDGAVSYSIETTSDYQAVNIVYHPFETSFEIYGQRFLLSMPGRHNLYNALACIALLAELGTLMSDIAAVLPGFSGIERRFDIHLNDGKHLVIDDYAHNPHKISSLIRTMQQIAGSVCYIFQPHGFGPTRMMKDGYISTFINGLRSSDSLVLLPIYYAGGTAAKDISSEDLAVGIREAGRNAIVIQDRNELLDRLPAADAYVVLGARDDSLSGLAAEIANRLKY